MSTQITTSFAQQYTAGVMLNYQQSVSVFRGHVDQEPVTSAKNAYFDRVGSTFASVATTRHEPTQYTDTPHFRRMCPVKTHRVADLIDDDDKLSTVNNPTNSYSRAQGAAMARQYDDTVIAFALATAATGEDGTGTSGTPTSNADHDETAPVLDDWLGVKQRMDDNNVPAENRHFVMHPFAYRLMLGATPTGGNQFTSSDYATVKALVRGEIDTFLGFKWHMSTRLLTTGDDTRCFAWHQDALKVGMSSDVFGSIDVLPDYNFSTQVFFSMRFGGVRMEEEGVEEFDITTSGS